MPSWIKPGATTDAATAYAAVVGMPMPRMIAMIIANTSASSWLLPAIPRIIDEKRPPTPVSPITPTIKPAHAQTAINWIVPCAPAASASVIRRGPIRVSLWIQLTTSAASRPSVPARITE